MTCRHDYINYNSKFCYLCDARRPLYLTGGHSDYYSVYVTSPTSGGEPYTAECNDIIEAMEMNFAEGNILKAVWRRAAHRMGRGKPGGTMLYNSEKIVFFGERCVKQDTHDTHEGNEYDSVVV